MKHKCLMKVENLKRNQIGTELVNRNGMEIYKLTVYQDGVAIYTVEATIDYINIAIKNLSEHQSYELHLINQSTTKQELQ